MPALGTTSSWGEPLAQVRGRPKMSNFIFSPLAFPFFISFWNISIVFWTVAKTLTFRKAGVVNSSGVSLLCLSSLFPCSFSYHPSFFLDGLIHFAPLMSSPVSGEKSSTATCLEMGPSRRKSSSKVKPSKVGIFSLSRCFIVGS